MLGVEIVEQKYIKDLSNGKIDGHKNIMVLDVETLGVSQRWIFDISWIVVNMANQVVLERNYLVRESFDSISDEFDIIGGYIQDAWYFKDGHESNKLFYKKMLRNKEIEVKSWFDIVDQLKEDLKQTIAMTAFNNSFDLSAIEDTHIHLSKIKEKFLKNSEGYVDDGSVVNYSLIPNTFSEAYYKKYSVYPTLKDYYEKGLTSYFKKTHNIDQQYVVFDLLMVAAYFVAYDTDMKPCEAERKSYYTFCMDVNMKTGTGKPNTTAQAFYNYFKYMLDYSKIQKEGVFYLQLERHTANADVHMEYAIFQNMVKLSSYANVERIIDRIIIQEKNNKGKKLPPAYKIMGY